VESLIYVNTETVTAHCTPTGNGPPRVICTLLAQWKARFSFFVTGEDPAAVAGITLRCVLKEVPTGAVLLASSTATLSAAVYTFDFASVDSSGLRTLIGDADQIELQGEIEWTLSGRVERVYFPVTVLNSRHRPDDGAPDPADSASNAWLSARAVRFDEAQTLTTEQKAQARTNIGVTSGVSDHGALTGLADDDHTQYFNQTRGDARYPLASAMTSALAAKEPLQTLATQAEMEAGTVTDPRRMSPKLVADAIAALSSGGIDLPVAIADGGTGSTTAQAARVALGTETLVPGVAQVAVISIAGNAQTSWAGQYVDLDDGTEVCRFWFTVDGSGSAPSAPSPGRLQVVAVVDGASANDVESNFLTAMSAQSSAFSAVGSSFGYLTVTNVLAAASPSNSSTLSDVSLNITTAGADSYRQLPAIDGSQLTNVSPAFIPPPGVSTLGGVILSQSFTGQFVKGVDGTGDLLYDTPQTDTAAQIRDKLVSLTGTNRLPATAIKDLPSGGGWEMVQNATASSNANIIFDSIFSSGYEWRIRMEDFRAATANTVIYLMPRAGGADLGTTETGRTLECFSATSTAATGSRLATAGVVPFGSAISNLYKSNFILAWRPDVNTRNIIFDGFGSYNQTATSVSGYFTGVVAIAAQPTGIKILFSSGNIAEGKFAVERRPITAIP
jgi:hypothetical protein